MVITAEQASHVQPDSKQHGGPSSSSNANMDPEPLDFDECLKDSPKFRQSLKDHLNYVENLESCMSKTIKQVSNYIDTGREHIKSQKDLITSMRTLNGLLGGKSNSEVNKRVGTLLDTLNEFMTLYEIVIDQSARTVGNSLSKFISDDLLKLREARKSFDKISHEYDLALTKYSQPLKKQQEDSENLLIATSTAFTHTSLDLSIQLTTLQSKKGYEILNSLLSFTKAHGTFFHQGSDLFCEDLKPHISDMDEFLSKIQDEFEILIRNLPSKHLMVSNNELRPLHFDNSSEQVHLEGYLFKRASNGFKVWNRRWFILRNHQLLYQKRGEQQPTVMEEDVRLLTVKPVDKADNERRFCFEILSPHKSHILQADSELACKTWISAIQAGINAAFHDTEHKAINPRPVVSSESHNCKDSAATASATTGSSWGSGFSFKALHQQASNKLNSITNDIAKVEHRKDKHKLSSKRRDEQSASGDELDGFKVDEAGRSYAPLNDNDDCIDDSNDEDDDEEDECDSTGAPIKRSGKTKKSIVGFSYPKPATDPVQTPAHSTNHDAPEKPQRAYMIILAMPGNDACADCGANQPRWASINLGITLCIECAGIHRSLGVHLSKVRSLTLDTEVWSPEIVQLMLSLGNSSVNAAYLACYKGKQPPIEPDCSREDREAWIKSKYLLKNFMRAPGVDSSYSEDVQDTTTSGDSPSKSQEGDTQSTSDDMVANEDLKSVPDKRSPDVP